jgi:hypothetical protein
MSNKNISFANKPQKYFVPHVSNNSTYPTHLLNDQIAVIDQQKDMFPKGHKNDPKIPLNYFTQNNHNNGNNGNNNDDNDDDNDKNISYNKNQYTRFSTYSVDINSANRQIVPLVDTTEGIVLTNNPLSLTKNSTIMTIYVPNNTFSINDKITLTGIEYQSVILRTITTTSSIFTFTNGSQYLAINYPHGIDASDQDFATSYDTSDVYIKLSGFIGNISDTQYDNIPTNTINTTQNVIITNPITGSVSSNQFFIKLYKTYSGTGAMKQYNITLTFLYYAGIPTNLINATYPVNNEHLNGYLTVVNRNASSISVSLKKISGSSLIFGGGHIILSLITDLLPGYPNPNYYKISLGKTYKNVFMVRLLSSEFPNTEQVIKNMPTTKQNNKIYWQNQDDGTYTYSVMVPPGNYTPKQLSTTLEDLFYSTPRVNYDYDISSGNTCIYTDHNIIKTNINPETNIVTFSSFKETPLIQPISSIIPEISTNTSSDPNPPITNYIMVIIQQYHGFSVGSIITISGAITHLGIPANVINQTFSVLNVIDGNTYTIQLPPFNLLQTREITKGGVTFTVTSSNNFRLLFNYSDTLGKILGFRNPGIDSSITNYNYVIKNSDPYISEQPYNDVGQPMTITNGPLLMSGENYILMKCTGLDSMISTTPIKESFAKILLSGLPGKMLYNSFINIPTFFYDETITLSTIEVFFYAVDGTLYNFNGVDHSFTLEITTAQDLIKGLAAISNNFR